jgi:hypothetical protein
VAVCLTAMALAFVSILEGVTSSWGGYRWILFVIVALPLYLFLETLWDEALSPVPGMSTSNQRSSWKRVRNGVVLVVFTFCLAAGLSFLMKGLLGLE